MRDAGAHFGEVQTEPHITERDTFFRNGDSLEPAPAPRFSRSRSAMPTPPRSRARTPKPCSATGIHDGERSPATTTTSRAEAPRRSVRKV